ncbi:cleavage stimulation factor subunit 2-like [Uloborus diversus]|uniref:cleavage stimulation factor subunit 2-like n=1 Tax=Uloborus diversus TaxID=327109 RepID=UPI00240A173A|nr:cleavage stimulation factor subunit 2-like [Uloborus diversus]
MSATSRTLQDGTMSFAEHAMRSVVIGNIPQDVTEDQMKEIISEVGEIIIFRLFYDESGKSTGIGFCEYKDLAIAHSALRNLNGLEIKGRALVVDSAASEKGKEILRSMQRSSSDLQLEEADSTTEKAPEEISKAVASLPAEQMFELMKQMKLCIENNPQEARNLLLQNPQLAYALLQAQVIMRIVDPQVALKILNRPVVPPASEDKPATEAAMQSTPSVSDTPATFPAVEPSPVPPPINPMAQMLRPAPVPMARLPLPIERPPIMPVMPGSSMSMLGSFGDQDLRVLGDRDLRLHATDRDMRSLPMLSGDKDMRQLVGDQDMRTMGGIPDNRPFDPRFRGSAMNRAPPGIPMEKSRPPNVDPRTAYEGQNIPAPVRVEDPRKAAMTSTRVPPPALLNVGPSAASLDSARQIMHPGNPNAPHDQEKAALIMQVLQLTDQQIASLPPEQRQSILVLKEQIARSHAT